MLVDVEVDVVVLVVGELGILEDAVVGIVVGNVVLVWIN